ncbi:MAG: Uma2 family endonuclease [Microcoleaceae cyanobacterium]
MKMTLSKTAQSEIFYPSSDSEPVAETYDHLYAMLTILEVLWQYLQGQQATILCDQFLYYAEGFPKLRVTPDVMVIFDVEPGGRDNYKIWEEGQTPSVIFEITSPSTRQPDREFKKELYEGLNVQEYWLFDPKGEWIPEKLLGYTLWQETYRPILESRSTVLQLRLAVEEQLVRFYREDTGEKLPISDELVLTLQEEAQARQVAEARAERLAEKLRSMGIDPDQIDQ